VKTLIFNAPSQDTLVEGEKTIHGGELFEVDDARAEELVTNPTVDVSEYTSASTLKRLTKPQLIELAEERDIDVSSCKTKDDLIEAIEKAVDDSEPEA
jgi:hypothetical protein